MSSTSSPALEQSLSDSSEPECAPLPSANRSPTAKPSSASIGRTSNVIPMRDRFTLEMFPNSILSPEALPASALASPRPSMDTEPAKRSGRKWRGSSKKESPLGRSSSNPLGIPGGKLKLRAIWRALATTHPDLNDRLALVARLISDGACTTLPTPCASDATRCPGSSSHPRLNRARGLRLQEELGARPGPDIVEWMMGLPIGYTALEPSEMQPFLVTRKRSGGQS